MEDTDHAEAALGYVYPELKDKIDTYAKSLTLWSTTSNTPRKLILRSILDEIYKSPHFSYCKKHGLDFTRSAHIITTKANMNKGIAEVSTSLTRKLVEDALKSTKRAFSKLQDLFISSWEVKNGGI